MDPNFGDELSFDITPADPTTATPVTIGVSREFSHPCWEVRDISHQISGNRIYVRVLMEELEGPCATVMAQLGGSVEVGPLTEGHYAVSASINDCFGMTSFDVSPEPVVINVPADHSTIQAAIDAANSGDTIIVSPGTYVENINFLGKDIILRSTEPSDPSVVAATIIDGSEAGSVVTFSGAETCDCVLTGFTIINGRAHSGAGICGNDTMATIERNTISGNTAGGGEGPGAYGFGGGLGGCNGVIRGNVVSNNTAMIAGGINGCGGIVQNNIIRDNHADYLGGELSGSFTAIQNNVIRGNSADGHGGGLAYCSGTIQNNLVFGNSAPWGVGGGLQMCEGDIQNNTIWGNYARNGGGGLAECAGTIRNCIIWQNTRHIYDDTVTYHDVQLDDCVTPSYSCIQDWTGEDTGNTPLDPQLLDPDNGDFHLTPESPCIDAGAVIEDLAEDFEGDLRGYDGVSEPRGDGSDFDIGADEFQPSANAHHLPVPDDTDGDLLTDDEEMQMAMTRRIGTRTTILCLTGSIWRSVCTINSHSSSGIGRTGPVDPAAVNSRRSLMSCQPIAFMQYVSITCWTASGSVPCVGKA